MAKRNGPRAPRHAGARRPLLARPQKIGIVSLAGVGTAGLCLVVLPDERSAVVASTPTPQLVSAQRLAAPDALRRSATDLRSAADAQKRKPKAEATPSKEDKSAAAETPLEAGAPEPQGNEGELLAGPSTDDLDGWITRALEIMQDHGIPGTYEGIHRNIMRESSGDPNAINEWDTNAQNGTPSMGLLQVIRPTFDAYRIPGTVDSPFEPVANIVAACNYAADRYGSIDNVNGPY
ncbi:transglycosylase SLT domain-containing protein [Streptomyces sp. TRM66268-LWL]|uniref:Transglycosylase SLT domain-containing protein n=1 Tax=Streptomyces polyasparticus TaxID=2767826 RepID=A0ABR7SVS7_9ACTN|nr:transglycosylase SLT domain-containing protein [Streptomyces polyasparticus]MBC9719596.1 transglycosylase SLT domain-containing protein [Streptomyces polyasparticus]